MAMSETCTYGLTWLLSFFSECIYLTGFPIERSERTKDAPKIHLICGSNLFDGLSAGADLLLLRSFAKIPFYIVNFAGVS